MAARFLLDKERKRRILLNEFLVVPSVIDNCANHALNKRGIRTGQNRHPLVRLRSRARETRVDRHDVGTRFLRIKKVLRPDNRAFERIMAKLDNGGRVFELAIRASRAMAERTECRTHAIGLTTIKTPISASFRMDQRRNPFKIDTSLGRFAHEYRILSICFLGFLKLLIDGIDCFIPAYLDELAFAALAHALHRRLQTIFGIDMGDLVDTT